jgi:outer membrane protein TolC
MRKYSQLRSRTWTALVLASLTAVGCHQTHKEVSFLGDAEQDHYRTHATAIEYPDVQTETPEAVRDSLPPRTLNTQDECEIREISLTEAIHLGMSHSEVVKSGGQFLTSGSSVVNNADRVTTSFDAAIQESGVLFGGRGVEAALADFDAQFNASMKWGRNDTRTLGAGPAFAFNDARNQTAGFSADVSKTFGYGGSVDLFHQVDFLDAGFNPGIGTGRPNLYSGTLGAQYRQPLLAGAGTEFTRIAGPIARSFGGITGVSQGVVIARINNDLVLCDYENALRNLARDIEESYWNLYLTYQLFDTATQAYEASVEASRIADLTAGNTLPADNGPKARDLLYTAKAAVDTARSSLYSRETELRRLIGLPVNDGTVLRPTEDPTTSRIVPDWHHSLSEALTHRVELRKQKWNIRSLDLQLTAARSLTRPRLDAVGNYQVNAAESNLLGYGSDRSFYQGLTGRNTDGWGAGVEMTMPIGLRSAHAQVRNYELRLAKAQKVLAISEEDISHELAVAFQELARTYAVAQDNYNRYLAAEENVRITKLEFQVVDMDRYLDALPSRARAQQAYYESLIDYNKAITNLYHRKGTLLAHDNIQIAEGGWSAEAYQDASRLHHRRAYGNEIDVEAAPQEFVLPAPMDRVDFTTYQPSEKEPVPVSEPTESVNDKPPVAP